VGFKPRFPFWFEGQFDKRLRCPILHDRDAEWAFFQFPWFGYPNPAHWFCGCVQVHCGDQFQPLWWCQALYAIDPGSLFPGVFLGHPPHRKAFRTPGRGEKFLELAGFLYLSTGRCLIDSSLELEHTHLELAPGDRVPFIPMTLVMAHDFSTLLEDSIVEYHRPPVGISLALHGGLGFRGDPCRLTRAGSRTPTQF